MKIFSFFRFLMTSLRFMKNEIYKGRKQETTANWVIAIFIILMNELCGKGLKQIFMLF